MVSGKKQTLKSLKAGRPPLSRSSRTMSRKASRSLINSHHQLDKRRLQAITKGNKVEAAAITEELAKLGGLSHYQQASLQGQSHERGGDTSKILLQWLPESVLNLCGRPLKMLEVGALSTSNACSTSGIFDVVHIDLHSQGSGILQQDFMERPLPQPSGEDGSEKGDRFDIISLSLVLNFVPDGAGRGQMLARTVSFLRDQSRRATPLSDPEDELIFPCLFVVLPRSCVTNSRYFTTERFEELMSALGYVNIRAKQTQKLTYTLWRQDGRKSEGRLASFPKKEINPGKTRNNFVITLDGSSAG